MRGATLNHMLREAAARFPNHEAIVAEGLRLRYAEFHAEVLDLAERLRRLGANGERVAIVMANGPAIVVAIFAVLEAGAHVVPLNPD